MPNAAIRRLAVVGANKAPAEVVFGPTLTFITGASNTGKSHIFACINFALGGSVPERGFDEAKGYQQVLLELSSGSDIMSVRRSFGDADHAEWFAGPIDEWDEEQTTLMQVKVDRKKADATLGGRLLEAFGFDSGGVLVANAAGKTQALSPRTISHLFLVSEEEVFTSDSLVAPPGITRTANRSGFNLMISGRAPSDAEIEAIREAAGKREQAENRLEVLDPLIESLRVEIAESGTRRADLERDLADVDQQLSGLSELVAASGDQVRALLDRRNRSLARAEEAGRRSTQAHELRNRFELLAQHYESDVERLEFSLESGHFFGQLSASYCPRCGRPLPNEEECHPETADFAAIEKASRAEIKKLAPRIADLQDALADVRRDAEEAIGDEERARGEAAWLDAEIREVANPSAAAARQRVQSLARRRQEIEAVLLQHRELDRYVAMRLEADLIKKRPVDSYKPIPPAASLRSLQTHVHDTLGAWRFPVVSDVVYDASTDDIAVDGKPRVANGKGFRAVMHAAFVVGLMRHCLAVGTPHPGFVVIDSPLTPYKETDLEPDTAESTALRDVRSASLHSLATVHGQGQSVVLENIDTPEGLEQDAMVYVFTGQPGNGRAGFYPA